MKNVIGAVDARTLATVHRLRPRTVTACAPAGRRSQPSSYGIGVVVELSARRTARPLFNFEPPEGHAA